MDILEAVKEILAKQLRVDVDSISEDTDIMDDLGADSISVLQLLMTIEEDYGIVIPDEKLAAFNTVGDVVAYLESQK